LGGKLRPSFTLTATIALDQDAQPIEAPQVASSRIQLEPIPLGVAASTVTIGGTVSDAVSHATLASVALSLMELRVLALSDDTGRFRFPGVVHGTYSIRAVKSGYTTQIKTIQVPGDSPTAFDIALSPT
jgi:hypothetical protein